MRGLRIVRAIVSTRERQLFAIALLVRLLPDQIYAIGGRLVLWAFVCYWWILRLGRSLSGAFRRLILAAATGDDVR